MAFPQVAATNSGNNNTASTSHTINLPIGIAADNLLMIFFDSDGEITATTPTGWTSLASSAGFAAGTPSTWIYYKVADGTESSTISITTGSAKKTAHVTYRITGWHGTTVPEASGRSQGTIGGPNAPSLNPTNWDVEDTLWIAVGTWGDGTISSTAYPLNHPDNHVTDRSAATDGVGIAAATRELAAASADPDAFSLSAPANWKGYTIAVRPAVAPPETTIDSGPTGTVTSTSATFTFSASIPGSTFETRIDGGSWVSSTGPKTYTGLSIGSHTFDVRAIGSTGSVDPTPATRTWTINAAPVAGFSVSGSGFSRTFTDASADTAPGTIVSRLWDFGDGTTSTLTNPSHTYAVEGSYTAILTVTDDLGATDTAQATITIVPPGMEPHAYLDKVFPRDQGRTTLSGPINGTQDTVPLTNLTYWPQSGPALIGKEMISYTGKSSPNGPGQLTGCTRGEYGTDAAAHDAGEEAGVLGRHDSAISTRRLVKEFTGDGAITLQALGRWWDGDLFLWADFDNRRERVQLDLAGAPTSSGNVSTTLDENGVAVAKTVAVSAAKEKRTLTINNPVTSSGDVTVTLGGVDYRLSVEAAIAEQVQITYSGNADISSSIRFYYYDTTNTRQEKRINENSGTSATKWAGIVRGTSFPGWTLSGTGSTVVATATTAGDKGAGSSEGFQQDTYIAHQPFDITTLREGSAGMTAIQAADLIRNTSFPGYITGGTPGTATVTIEAIEPGPKTGTFSYSAGSTGATSTAGLTQITAGTATTTDAIASAIRALYATNAYWEVGGVGSLVTWRALTDGAKLATTFNPQGTGTKGTMQTVVRGGRNVVVYIRDSLGEVRKRVVMAGIVVGTTGTVFTIELAVSGAGVHLETGEPLKDAVVMVWGHFRDDEPQRLWRVTDLNLAEHQAGYVAYGVIGEVVESVAV